MFGLAALRGVAFGSAGTARDSRSSSILIGSKIVPDALSSARMCRLCLNSSFSASVLIYGSPGAAENPVILVNICISS